jgi:periplasmic protein TonB
VHVQSEMMNNQLTAPTRIPHDIKMVAEKEAPPSSGFGVAGMEGLGGGGVPGAFANMAPAPKVQAAVPKKVNISAGVASGMLLQKTLPVYPPIAKAARVSGTVILQATISKEGTITNLHVVGGPAMLQQAAMDAVRTWRYRPYLLNNEPVEVDTTINVVFTLGG